MESEITDIELFSRVLIVQVTTDCQQVRLP